MKKSVTLLVWLTAFAALAQGTVRFDNNVPGVLVTHVYGVNPISPQPAEGNGPSDYPPGPVDWTGWTPAAGSGFSAQLFAAPGADADFSSLTPASPNTKFQTGANAGFVTPLIAPLQAIPADTPVPTLQMRVWDNQNGTINSWQDARLTPISRWGASFIFNVQNIGGAVNPAPILNGLQSFALGEFFLVPEPCSLTLVEC